MGWFFSPRSPEQIEADIAAWTAEQDRLAARSKLQAWWEDTGIFIAFVGVAYAVVFGIMGLMVIGLASLFK